VWIAWERLCSACCGIEWSHSQGDLQGEFASLALGQVGEEWRRGWTSIQAKELWFPVDATHATADHLHPSCLVPQRPQSREGAQLRGKSLTTAGIAECAGIPQLYVQHDTSSKLRPFEQEINLGLHPSARLKSPFRLCPLIVPLMPPPARPAPTAAARPTHRYSG
jgi:hypothetical protein